MPKVTIYLPEALHAAVKAAEITVSPICQGALRKEVERMKMIEKADAEIKGVAARLRDSMNEVQERRYDVGIYYGMDWASVGADWDDLSELVNMESNWLNFQSESVGDYLSVMEDPDLYNVVFGERNSFTYGFIEGAKRIYKKVLPLMGG